jgi:hypothetical protein
MGIKIEKKRSTKSRYPRRVIAQINDREREKEKKKGSKKGKGQKEKREREGNKKRKVPSWVWYTVHSLPNCSPS